VPCKLHLNLIFKLEMLGKTLGDLPSSWVEVWSEHGIAEGCWGRSSLWYHTRVDSSVVVPADYQSRA
jgi:hypothetical protein